MKSVLKRIAGSIDLGDIAQTARQKTGDLISGLPRVDAYGPTPQWSPPRQMIDIAGEPGPNRMMSALHSLGDAFNAFDRGYANLIKRGVRALPGDNSLMNSLRNELSNDMGRSLQGLNRAQISGKISALDNAYLNTSNALWRYGAPLMGIDAAAGAIFGGEDE